MKVVLKDDPGPIFEGIGVFVEGELQEMAILEKGMESGKTSVMFKVTTQDGQVVVVQTSAAMLLTLADGLKGGMLRFGDAWDGV